MMILEVNQMESKLMTEREKADIFMKSMELQNAGNKDEAKALRRTMPMKPYLAKFIKEKLGTEVLLELDWNLAEAEAEFGQDWLAS
jgi:hypothetical protein